VNERNFRKPGRPVRSDLDFHSEGLPDELFSEQLFRTAAGDDSPVFYENKAGAVSRCQVKIMFSYQDGFSPVFLKLLNKR